MKYEEHIWKCFLLDIDTGSVLGVITENKKGVSFQQLGNAGNGKFYSMGTSLTAKKFLEKRNFISTLDYQEAYQYLIKKNVI